MSLESTTSEESTCTTSSREGQDEDWYREAVNSSDERDPAIIKSKDKSKHPDVPVNKSFIYKTVNLNILNLKKKYSIVF